jgi:AraC-like DNA-binding protein
MTMLETGLRGGAIALLLLLAAVGWRDRRLFPAARYGALFALCGVAYLIEAAPILAGNHSRWIYPVRLLSVSAPGVFYLWAAAHFDDTFTPSWQGWLPWLGMLILGGWAIAAGQSLPWRAVQVTALVLVGAGVWRALAGRAGDLIEGRRRFRLVLAIGVAVFIASLNLLAFVLNDGIALATSLAGPAAVCVLGFAAAVLRLETRPLGDASVVVTPAAQSPAAPVVLAPPRVDAEETRLLTRLQTLIEAEKVFREDGLSVVQLARRLGIQEYQLRRLINQRLGHRNFSAFVNGYRLSEVAAALDDPEQDRVPILTIALDAGFQSIGPFNRAFKAQFGVTPSEYRRDRQAQAQRRAAE